MRLRHARQLLARSPVNALLALESDVVLAGAGDSIWRPPSSSAALDLDYALGRLRPGGELPVGEPPSHVALPDAIAPDDASALPALLKPAEKRALDLLADWPWILQRDLAGLMGVSEARGSHILANLESLGLVARVAAARGRPALTDQGLSLLARRDRTSVGVARKRWSAEPADPRKPLDWRNVSGGRSRQLLRNIQHSAAVHGFLAALAKQARGLGWEVVQVDPPHRASRHFRHGDGWRSVNPDAFGVLRKAGTTWPFFLEWERRAVRPVTMAARLAPYLRYYSSHRPTDDHGTRPSVLVVFDDPIAPSHFLTLAGREMRRAGVNVPLWVSHRQAIGDSGPLGRAWLSPGHWEPVRLPPSLQNTHKPNGEGNNS